MRHICAWCKCETAPPDGTADDDIISHGICEECKNLVLAGMEGLGGTGAGGQRSEVRSQISEIRSQRLEVK